MGCGKYCSTVTKQYASSRSAVVGYSHNAIETLTGVGAVAWVRVRGNGGDHEKSKDCSTNRNANPGCLNKALPMGIQSYYYKQRRFMPIGMSTAKLPVCLEPPAKTSIS